MYLALDMKSVADACSAVGLDRVGSDWEGVKYLRLAVDGKFGGKKDVKQALLEPAVAEWWAEQPVTREARQNNG